MNGGELPDHPGTTLGQFLLDNLRRHAATLTKPAQIEAQTGTKRSYSELLTETVQAAAAWRSLGIKITDTIAVYSRNNHCKYAALLGAIYEGVTIATIHPTAKEDELRLLLSRIQPRALVCDAANVDIALQVAGKDLLVLVTADQCDAKGALTVPDFLRKGSAVDVDAYRAAPVEDVRKHAAFLVFSSGTTGLPKGVMCSDYAITLNALMLVWMVEHDDVVLVNSPVSWITGIMYTFISIVQGATRVVCTYTNEVEALDVLQKYKITTAFIAPARYFLLAGLVKSLRQKGVPVDLSAMRVATAGGSVMTADLQKTSMEVLGVPIVQIYGCTETLAISGDRVPPLLGSVGKVAPGILARFVDMKTGEDVTQPHTPGELRIKTDCYMLGYINDPDTTAKSVDDQGYYLTGDLAKFDENGNIFITDRIKEMLKFMNMEMTPAEIEDVLMSHAAVKDACVVGRPHDVVGDIPTAFVVLFPGKRVQEQELQDLVKSRLSPNKQLRGGIFFVDEIPTSVNGKYDRKVLRQRLSKLPPVSDQQLGLAGP